MSQSLTRNASISTSGVAGIFDTIITNKIILKGTDINNVIDRKISCYKNITSQLFITSSNCQVIELTDYFKDLICDAVNNYCPYYYCNNCNKGGPQRNFNFNNINNNFDSSDNSVSFFHEEALNDDQLGTDFSIFDTDQSSQIVNKKAFNKSIPNQNYLNFLAFNLNKEEYLVNDNLKIISLGKINKGKWLFNSNISIEFPKFTPIKNLKAFVYLDENVVPAGEIDLGSHHNSNESVIKSFPFNLMFQNNLSGSELKIGLLSVENSSNIKLLKSSNFFANLM